MFVYAKIVVLSSFGVLLTFFFCQDKKKKKKDKDKKNAEKTDKKTSLLSFEEEEDVVEEFKVDKLAIYLNSYLFLHDYLAIYLTIHIILLQPSFEQEDVEENSRWLIKNLYL